jgi:hypothetical protein
MKRFSNRKLILLFCIPLLSIMVILFFLPFGERARFQRELDEYQEVTSGIEVTEIESGEITTAQSTGKNNSTVGELPLVANADVSDLDSVSFPPQPIGAPYPRNWPELLQWVGSPQEYEGSLEELNGIARTWSNWLFDHSPPPDSPSNWDVRALFNPEYRVEPEKQDTEIKPRNLRNLQEHIFKRMDLNVAKSGLLFDSELDDLKLMAVELRPQLDRLRDYRNGNGVYVDPRFGASEFSSTHYASFIRHYASTYNFYGLDQMVFLESVYWCEIGETDRALENILTQMRLQEHFNAGWNLEIRTHPGEYFSILGYLLWRHRFTEEQLMRVIEWTHLMEQRLDCGNLLAGTQILAQQFLVVEPNTEDSIPVGQPMDTNPSVVDEMFYLFHDYKEKMARSDAAKELKHKRFLMSPIRYELQSDVLQWFSLAHKTRNSTTLTDFGDDSILAADLEPIDPTLAYSYYSERARYALGWIGLIMTQHISKRTQLRIARAACVVELYRLKTGEYASSLSEAADFLDMPAPRDFVRGNPLRVQFNSNSYEISHPPAPSVYTARTDVMSRSRIAYKNSSQVKFIRILDAEDRREKN